MTTLTVVIPAYNEEDGIAEIAHRVLAVRSDLRKVDVDDLELIIVDDGSNDGTFAVYAHLNWNSIRVRAGERVRAGQYIADSGNTGFSSGPHLHFAVQRNTGMRIEALPVVFEGPNSRSILPATGNVLTSYP